MHVGVILPALNAASFVGPLLDEIRERQPDIRALVVDDGSTDGTGDVARAHGAEIATHAQNRGKGAALLTGFQHALAAGWDWTFTMDADGQHLPAEMQSFLDAALSASFDIVVGTRMDATADMPWIRKATNVFTSRVVSRLAGCPIPDSQNGYRLLRVAVLDGLETTTANYDFESEVLVRLARRGARIGSVPTAAVYGEQGSSIRPLRDTVRFFRLVYRLRREARRGDRR
ncbi:glycosyltransferase family 2 protein [bacterium]|nr:glycosyltransferase family 2 protein [bacterium]MBU1073168.1 glycosyltransferase family 2 protein [bacterium]MBU1675416.1 glycosyltransferase family 2 protein [bacterium]